MKIISILATIVITVTGCKCKKDTMVENKTIFPDKSVVTTGKAAVQQTEVPTIYYEANARNYTLSCKVENQKLYVSRERDFKDYSDKMEISDVDWAQITVLAKAVNLDKVKDMKWPTEMRYYDGAPHANIIFESKGVKYPANGFDHGHPPVEVEKLVNIILKLVENK